MPADGSISATGSIEKRLFDAMDEAALGLIEKLQDKSLDVKDRERVFRLGMDWLAKSRRLRPKSDEDLPMGIEGMREFIRNEVKSAKVPGSPRAKIERTRRNAKKAKTFVSEGRALAKALGAAE